MSAYDSLNLKRDVAARAREIAFRKNIPLTSLLSELIDAAYLQTFGHEALKRVVRDGSNIVLKLDGQAGASIVLPIAEAQHVALTIKASATGAVTDRTDINLDTPHMLTVRRQGRGVIIESLADDGSSYQKAMNVRDASGLAEEIREALA